MHSFSRYPCFPGLRKTLSVPVSRRKPDKNPQGRVVLPTAQILSAAMCGFVSSVSLIIRECGAVPIILATGRAVLRLIVEKY